MNLSCAALLASTLAVAVVDAGDVRRWLSQQKVAGYEPGSKVTDHCAIDLDQAAIQTLVGNKTPESLEKAKAIYNNGGNSKSYAQVTLAEGLASAGSKGDAVLGKNAAGAEVLGKLYKDAAAGAKDIQIQYETSDIQETYVGCQVGALDVVNTEGCFAGSGALAIGSPQKEYSYTYDPLTQNNNGRTIEGFSTAAESKMSDYTDYNYFKDYYGKGDYAHRWIEAAFAKGKTDFDNGNADFSQSSNTGIAEFVKKGTAYLSIFMYVIREFEDALDDCEAKCATCNDDAVHAWDEGVCFYTGSLEGQEPTGGDGNLLHALADKRCQNYKTCGESGTELSGLAKVNHEIFDLLAKGNYQLTKGECSSARATTKEIVKLMYIPLIQGTLRYAYKVSELKGVEKEKAEGAVFAAAVLPRIHAASESAAKTIYDNMKVGASSTDYAAVKTAFESTYENLGITCEDVGGLWYEGESKYYPGMEPCVTTEASGALRPAGLAAAVASLCASVLYFL